VVRSIDIFRGNLLSGGVEPKLFRFFPKNPRDQFLSALFDGQKGRNPEKKVTQKNWPWFVGFAEPSDQALFCYPINQKGRQPRRRPEQKLSTQFRISRAGWSRHKIRNRK